MRHALLILSTVLIHFSLLSDSKATSNLISGLNVSVEYTPDNLCTPELEGSLTITVSGGTGNYEYSIDAGNSWQSDNTYLGLSTGNYHIMAREADLSCTEDYGIYFIGCNDGSILQFGDAIYTCIPTLPDNITLAVDRIQTFNQLYEDGFVFEDASPFVQQKAYSWTVSDLGGPVYGVTFDSDYNIYTAISSLYQIIQPITSADVIKIDAATGNPEVITTLPGEWGVAQIEYDSNCDQLFASNLSDGKIYRIGLDGSILSTFDPFGQGNNDAIAPLGERITALAYHPLENKLYYAVWANDRIDNGNRNTIRSISLDGNCDFMTATDQMEISMPFLSDTENSNQDFSHPVLDLEFDASGTIMLAGESGFQSVVPIKIPHEARLLRFEGGTSSWSNVNNIPAGNEDYQYMIGTISGGTNSLGGVDFAYSGFDEDGCTNSDVPFIVAMGDALKGIDCTTDGCLYGFQYMPLEGGRPETSLLMDLAREPGSQQKGFYGDVDILTGCCPCAAPPVEEYDLSLTKNVISTGPFQPGDNVTYSINITNEGDIIAESVGFSDMAPASLTFVSDNSDVLANVTRNTPGNYQLSGLAPGTSQALEITYQISATATGTITNIAMITEDDGDDIDSDPDSGPDEDDKDDDEEDDDEDDEDINVDSSYDLALNKEIIGGGPFKPGDEITYAITISNEGTLPAMSMEFTDMAPASLIFVRDNSATNDNISELSRGVYQVSNLLPGSSEILELTYQIAEDAIGSITNLAMITKDDGDDIDSDPDQGPDEDDKEDDEEDDDEDETTITVDVIYDLAIDKEIITTGARDRGDTICIRTMVMNQGEVTAQNFQFTTAPPSDLLFVEDNADDVMAIEAVGTNVYAVSNLAVGEMEMIERTYVIAMDAVSPIISRVEITEDDGDDIDSNPGTSFDQDDLGDNLADDDESFVSIPLPDLPCQAASLLFNFDNCTAVNSTMSNQDYSEFTADIVNSEQIQLSVVGGHLYRRRPNVNKHSCTVGCNGTEAMCVSFQPFCNYLPGSPEAVRFDIEVNPNGIPVQVDQLSFKEQAPEMFTWIDGGSGLNNYPQFFALRILKNGVVIFEESDLSTSRIWNEAIFDFSELPEFNVSESTVFNFELLAYCPVGVATLLSIWDLEDIALSVECPTSCSENIDGGNIAIQGGATLFNSCNGTEVLELTNTSTANNVDYQYIVTDVDDNILSVLNGNENTLDISTIDAASFFIYGWSHLNSTQPITGDNLMTLFDGLCESISFNAIEVRKENGTIDAATLTGGPFEFCVDDNISDIISDNDIMISGAGNNTQWLVTDASGTIVLAFPNSLSELDLEGSNLGTCSLWLLNYDGNLTGLTLGGLVADIEGCFSLSNNLTINRISCIDPGTGGGNLLGGPYEFCIDTFPDFVSNLLLTGQDPLNENQWVITDGDGDILALPSDIETYDFNNTTGTANLIWNINYAPGLTGLEVGNNATTDLVGTFSLSNSISVTLYRPTSASITGGPFEFCVGDGIPDIITNEDIELTMAGNGTGTWLVTNFACTVIRDFTDDLSTIDFDQQDPDSCVVWFFTYDGPLSGLIKDGPVANLNGCFQLSEWILINKIECDPGTGTEINLTGGPYSFCSQDGEADSTGSIQSTGAAPRNWIITNEDNIIENIVEDISTFDFESLPAGEYWIRAIGYTTLPTGLEEGENLQGIQGDYILSNALSATNRVGNGGTISGGPFVVCAGDGMLDLIRTSEVNLEGNAGQSQWVITDSDRTIIGLTNDLFSFDFDGEGPANCMIWHLGYSGNVDGLAIGSSADNLEGCFSLSNPIMVEKNFTNGGIIESDEIFFCVGDGIPDFIPVGSMNLSGNIGMFSQWVITDVSGVEILDLPDDPMTMDFDGFESGLCLLWNISYNNELVGLEIGEVFNLIEGCFSRSNFITIFKNGNNGGVLEGGPFEFCVNDNTPDFIPDGAVTISDVEGTTQNWLVTDANGTITAIPNNYTDVDFDTGNTNECQLWNVSYRGVLEGLRMGESINDFAGCFDLSNSISIRKVICGTSPMDYQIFPNPSLNFLHLDFNNEITEDVEIRISNRFGQLEKMMFLSPEEIENEMIDISQLAPGIYYSKAIVGRQAIVKTFVKL